MPNCGECTVCCTLCVVPELEKKAGEHCKHCDGGGCRIYGSHPQSCKDFECAYIQGGKDIELRPDKCGIMFFKKSDRIFCGIMVQGRSATSKAGGQIRSFTEQGYSVVMLKIGENPNIVLADGHKAREIRKEYLELLNGDI